MPDVGEPDPLGTAADHASESAREWVQAAKDFFDDARGDAYTSDLLARDIAAFWARGVRDWARLVTDLVVVAGSLVDDAGAPPGPAQQPPGRAADSGTA